MEGLRKIVNEFYELPEGNVSPKSIVIMVVEGLKGYSHQVKGKLETPYKRMTLDIPSVPGLRVSVHEAPDSTDHTSIVDSEAFIQYLEGTDETALDSIRGVLTSSGLVKISE